MSDSAPATSFRRTLPLFDTDDRDVIQKLLHHTVVDFSYDHPDRKVARDLYHSIREGQTFRLHLGFELDQLVLVVNLSRVETASKTVIERLITETKSHSGEWQSVGTDLKKWCENTPATNRELMIGFEYLH